jgi:hypothetical protein
MRSQLRQEPRLVNVGLVEQRQCELRLVGNSLDDKLFDGLFLRADDFGVFGFMYSPFSPF